MSLESTIKEPITWVTLEFFVKYASLAVAAQATYPGTHGMLFHSSLLGCLSQTLPRNKLITLALPVYYCIFLFLVVFIFYFIHLAQEIYSFAISYSLSFN